MIQTIQNSILKDFKRFVITFDSNKIDEKNI